MSLCVWAVAAGGSTRRTRAHAWALHIPTVCEQWPIRKASTTSKPLVCLLVLAACSPDWPCAARGGMPVADDEPNQPQPQRGGKSRFLRYVRRRGGGGERVRTTEVHVSSLGSNPGQRPKSSELPTGENQPGTGRSSVGKGLNVSKQSQGCIRAGPCFLI